MDKELFLQLERALLMIEEPYKSGLSTIYNFIKDIYIRSGHMICTSVGNKYDKVVNTLDTKDFKAELESYLK